MSFKTEPSFVQIASTFDARPLEPGLRFWLAKLGASAEILCPPGCQPVATLLSMPTHSTHGAVIVLVRIEDLPSESGGREPHLDELQAGITALVDAIRTNAQRGRWPHGLIICPASPAWSSGTRAVVAAAAEAELVRRLDGVVGVSVLTSEQVARGASRDEWFHPLGWESGRVPYRPASYFALAREAARLIHRTAHAPYKVLVLDCDDTLWSGTCAEDGPGGVLFTERHRAVQVFARKAMLSGVLLCLCSKNSWQDVRAVFAHNPQMPLAWDDFAAVRINWQPKSANLRSLAEELGLGLDAFVFIDNNAVECAEVRAQLPEVVSIHLPPHEHAPALLDQLWAFDRQAGTAESSRRTTLQHDARKRDAARAGAATLEEFIAGLDLRITVATPEPSMWTRAAEVLLRTNQFNLNQSRDDEAALRARAETAFHHVRVVHVADRFGDYGLVGVLAWTHDDTTVMLDTFALSCRALGRGVEHRMLAYVGEWALTRGCDSIVLPFRAGPRSDPGRAFLADAAGFHTAVDAETETVELSARLAAAARMTSPVASQPAGARPAARPAAAVPAAAHLRARGLEAIAAEPDADTVFRGLQNARRPRPEMSAPFLAPRTEAERRVAAVWCAVLGLDSVGVDDDFNDLGGRSLDLVEVFGALSATDRCALAFTDLFRFTTVGALAARLADAPGAAVRGNPFEARANRRHLALAAQRGKALMK